jgi:hypothetical protein
MTCPDVEVTVRPAGNCGGGSDQGGKQIGRPEHKDNDCNLENPLRCEVALAECHGTPTHGSFGEGRCCWGSNR